MNLSQFKQFKYNLFYDDSIYNQIFKNVISIVKWDPTVLMELQSSFKKNSLLIIL
jgi:flagellar motor switch protein FliM